jgi:hypothetical protein
MLFQSEVVPELCMDKNLRKIMTLFLLYPSILSHAQQQWVMMITCSEGKKAFPKANSHRVDRVTASSNDSIASYQFTNQTNHICAAAAQRSSHKLAIQFGKISLIWSTSC